MIFPLQCISRRRLLTHHRGIGTLWVALAAVLVSTSVAAQATPASAPGPMLGQGIEHLHAADFDLDLVRSSQTIAALKPVGGNGFDFTPADWLEKRSADGYYHLGDLDLRLRLDGTDSWQSYSTAFERQPVTSLPVQGEKLASADLTPTLPS